MCCFFSTHTSQANPLPLPPLGFYMSACACWELQRWVCTTAVPSSSSSLWGVLCLCSCSVCVCQTACLVRCACSSCARVVPVFNQTVKALPCPFIPREFHKRANKECPVRCFTVLCIHLQNRLVKGEESVEKFNHMQKCASTGEKYATLSFEKGK